MSTSSETKRSEGVDRADEKTKGTNGSGGGGERIRNGSTVLWITTSVAAAAVAYWTFATHAETTTYRYGVDTGETLKLNLGCGHRHMTGYVNVDVSSSCDPDLVWDLENTPWPFADDSVDTVFMSHVLEHVGQEPETFIRIIQELYRVSVNGAVTRIIVPDPSHWNFHADPTHVRPVTFDLLMKFSKALNRQWISEKKADTPFALMYDVDFSLSNFEIVMDRQNVAMALERGILTLQEANNVTKLYEISKLYGNLIKQIAVDMTALK